MSPSFAPDHPAVGRVSLSAGPGAVTAGTGWGPGARGNHSRDASTRPNGKHGMAPAPVPQRAMPAEEDHELIRSRAHEDRSAARRAAAACHGIPGASGR